MKAIEKWGVDVDAAVNEALKDLKVSRDDVDIEVLEESSSGFLGIGSKLAKVRVTPKAGVFREDEKASLDDIDRILGSLPENNMASVPDDFRGEYERFEKEEMEDARAYAKAHPKQKKSGGKNKNRDRNRNKNGGYSKNKRDDENLSIESTLLFDIKDLTEVKDLPVEKFLRDIADEMGIDLDFAVKQGENVLFIECTGKDTGVIIGKRGQTLDAVQYLAGIVANKGTSGYTRVIIDAENYRAKRERTLVNLANRLAGKVERTGRSVTLEPMNPYERKVIHAALQSNPKVATRSEGKDPYRKVIIEKK